MSTFDDEETQSAVPLAPEIAVNIYNDVMMTSLVHEHIIIVLCLHVEYQSCNIDTRGAYKQLQHDATTDRPSIHLCL